MLALLQNILFAGELYDPYLHFDKAIEPFSKAVTIIQKRKNINVRPQDENKLLFKRSQLQKQSVMTT